MEIEKMEENMEFLDNSLDRVIEEFGRAFAPGLPQEVQFKLTKIAAFSWLSEIMHRAVQRHYGDNYKLAQPAENANNVSRLVYIFCTRDYDQGNNVPCISKILNVAK
jgi:hypothetical protein